jgi:hypothetical protein
MREEESRACKEMELNDDSERARGSNSRRSNWEARRSSGKTRGTSRKFVTHFHRPHALAGHALAGNSRNQCHLSISWDSKCKHMNKRIYVLWNVAFYSSAKTTYLKIELSAWQHVLTHAKIWDAWNLREYKYSVHKMFHQFHDHYFLLLTNFTRWNILEPMFGLPYIQELKIGVIPKHGRTIRTKLTYGIKVKEVHQSCIHFHVWFIPVL